MLAIIINNLFPNRLVETSGDCEWTDNIEYTRRRQTIHTHNTHYPAHSHMLCPQLSAPRSKPPPPPFLLSDILTTGYNKFICNRCKEIHLNVQTNIQHQIIDIKSPFQDVQPKIITNNIPCTEHTTKMTFLFFICIIHP